MKKTVSIIIPAYREEERIGVTLDRLHQFLEKNLQNYKIEILVVAADAPDNTHAIVQRYKKVFQAYQFKLLKPGKKVGKGRDVQYGFLRAKGDYRLFTDADLATPLEHIVPMIQALENGSDLVIGSRKISKIHTGLRSLVSIAGNILSKLMVGIYYRDTQCGFKGFTAQATETCFKRQKIMGWAFDIEILVIAKQAGLQVKELPIEDWTDMPGGTLSENVFRASWRTFMELRIIRQNLHSGQYRVKRGEI